MDRGFEQLSPHLHAHSLAHDISITWDLDIPKSHRYKVSSAYAGDIIFSTVF